MMNRSRSAGVRSMIITGGSLSESRTALHMSRDLGLYCTIGCHPTRSAEMDTFKGGPPKYIDALDELIQSGKEGKGRVVAVGECGLGQCLFMHSLHLILELNFLI